MIEKLDFMVRFWQLQARHNALGEPLTTGERVELLSLLRLMSTDQRLPDTGPAPRTDQGIPVQLTAPGGFLSGELRLVCADGIVLACASPLHAGQSTIVRLADAVLGVEYTLPCVVLWSYVGTPSAMALRVDGAPRAHELRHPRAGHVALAARHRRAPGRAPRRVSPQKKRIEPPRRQGRQGAKGSESLSPLASLASWRLACCERASARSRGRGRCGRRCGSASPRPSGRRRGRSASATSGCARRSRRSCRRSSSRARATSPRRTR